MATVKNSPKRKYAEYFVGVKALLRRGDAFLFLKDDSGLYIDLPGGRIDEVEHNVPIPEIIDREIKEEIGFKVKYRLGHLAFQFRRHSDDTGNHIFISVYEAEYLSGEVKLSHEHTGYQWFNPNEEDLKRKDFSNDEEFSAFKVYFKSLD